MFDGYVMLKEGFFAAWASAWLSRLACLVVLAIPSLVSAQQKHVLALTAKQDANVMSVWTGFKEGLKAGGLTEGKGVVFTLKSGADFKGDVKDFVSSALKTRPDLIVVFTADLTRTVLNETSTIPVIFVDVPDPVAAKLVSAMEPTGSNFSGVASSILPARQVELIRQIVPAAKRVGVLYNPKNPGSAVAVKQLMEGMAKFGVVIIDAGLSRSNEVGSAARSLAGKVDAFFSIDDMTVSQAYPAWVKVALDSKIPLIASQPDAMNTGALAGLAFMGKDVGGQSARMALRILRGTKPGSIAPEYIQKPVLWLNTTTALKQGIRLPEALLKSGVKIVTD